MSERENELASLIEDVKTIKSILQNEDTPLPRLWVPAWTASPVVAVVGLLQYLVPFFQNLDFDGRIWWLWLPAATLVGGIVLVFLHSELKRTGRGALGQGRVRHLLFARFVIPPAALVVVWVSSRNTAFGVEGIILLIAAIWQTAVEQLFPAGFRPIPFVFLTLGLAELALDLRGPETTLFNCLLISATLAVVGFLVRRQKQGGR